ncbi:MAG: uroporphyrinogen decarboxylase family protein [bacterium]
MTSRERVLTALRRKGKPDRTPFEISWGAFTPGLMATYRKRTGSVLEPAEYFDFDTRSIEINPPTRQPNYIKYFSENPSSRIIWDEWCVGSVPGSVEHFVEYRYHPLARATTADDVQNFDWPEIDADSRFEGLAEKTAAYHQKGYAVTGELYLTIFETAWLLRGLEQLLMDFYANEDLAHALCENLTTLRIRQAIKFAEDDVDILRLGDDISSQKGPIMSVDLYRTYLKERTRRIINAAKSVKPDILIFMHCDGDVTDFIPEYIDIGIDILNPVQPECNDLQFLGKQYGDKISFWGGVGTQTTMPFGTPDDVRLKVKEVVAQLGSNGGLLLAPTHILEPEVPWENVLAFIEAARES